MSSTSRLRSFTFFSLVAGLALCQAPASAQVYLQNLQSPAVNVLNARASTLGDFNADGRIDWAILSSGSSLDLTILLGDGAGGFATRATVAIDAGVMGKALIVAADLNSDRALDLLCSGGAQGIWRLLGTGTGTFGAPVVAIPLTGTEALAVADMNLDNRPDAVAAKGAFPANVMVALGNGGGSFAGPMFTGLAPGASALGLDVGDLNLDGVNDVLASSSGPFPIAFILTGNGAGGFLTPSPTSAFAFGQGATALGDIDRNGQLDAAIAVPGESATYWLAGDGAGHLTNPSKIVKASVQPSTVLLGDVSGDGRCDLLTSGPGSNSVEVNLGLTGGGLSTASNSFDVGAAPSSIVVGDANGDARPDLFLTSTGNPSATVRLSLTPFPVTGYGIGTPGCRGEMHLGLTGVPRVGNMEFGYVCTNAPPNAFGIMLFGETPDFAGTDVLNIGVKLHVLPVWGTAFGGFDMVTDASGAGYASTPIFNLPGLAYQTYFVQSIFIEDPGAGRACGTGSGNAVSSRGAVVSIVP